MRSPRRGVSGRKQFAVSATGGERFDEPEGRRALFAGDAVMRALTAAAMMPATDVTAPLLLEAMQDRYPIVRYFAANALAAQEIRHCQNRIIWPGRNAQCDAAKLVPQLGRQKLCALPEKLAKG